MQGSVGMACQLFRVTPEAATETQPQIHPSGPVLVFDGRLDNREELLAILKEGAQVSTESPDPALVLAAYDAFGDRLPEWLTGDFALGIFDPIRRQLLLARDSLGVRPLYYYCTRETFLFASEVKALLAHPRVSARPNHAHLAGLLLRGPAHDHQGLTFFAGVVSLLPAHVAILTSQGLVTRRYWDFDPTRQLRLRSFRECAEAFRHHFEQAVRRRLRSAFPVAVSVSGGLDSSSILCLAETLRRRGAERHPALMGVSYTSADGSLSDERAFLLEIERDYGITIERVPVGLGLLNGAREALWHIEAPFLDTQWTTTTTFLQTVRRLGARVLLTGHWGDQVLFDQAYLIDLVRRMAWGEARRHLQEYPRWFIEADPRYYRRRFFRELVRSHVPDLIVPLLRGLRATLAPGRQDRPWYTKAFWRCARPSLAKGSPIAGPFPTAHARSLYQTFRSRHEVLSMEFNNKVAAMHGLETTFPFLDRDLISVLMVIPGEMQTWKGVPKAILRDAMRGVLPEAIVGRDWKGDMSHLINGGMEQDYPHLVSCLEEGRRAVQWGYVKGDVMREALMRLKDQVRDPNGGATWRLLDLLGLELWLQVFFGEETREKESVAYGLAC